LTDIRHADNEQIDWPADGTEKIGQCPVCGGRSREILHKDLTDKTFYCAPGKWSLYRCGSCASAYLDPRPTAKTIGLAYQRYFTHNETPGYSTLPVLSKLKRRLVNGYQNHRFGTRYEPASIFGIPAVSLVPNGRATIDARMRHLPVGGRNRTMLDVGCGNGSFLLSARSAGWKAVGVDFDEKAVTTARSHGLDVRLGGVETLDPATERFDVITLSHVIEHVHHPVSVLEACYDLLKTGGHIWIDTPNISSQGHEYFGRNWRGLEPPRHLVLFTLQSMRNALEMVGFSNVTIQPYIPLCKSLFRSSLAIEKSVDAYSAKTVNVSPSLVKKAEKVAKQYPEKREFVTVTAMKQ